MALIFKLLFNWCLLITLKKLIQPMLNWKAVVKSCWIFITWRALRSKLFCPRPRSSTFLLLLWLPFLFDSSPTISSCPDVSAFLSSFTQCPGGCPSTCILPYFPRLFSIHCSEVTLASLPASLFCIRASRWQRRAMAPDPMVTSFPSCASSHFPDVGVVYHLPLLYFLMMHFDWSAYSSWESVS